MWGHRRTIQQEPLYQFASVHLFLSPFTKRALATAFTDFFSTSEALRKRVKLRHLINPSPPKTNTEQRVRMIGAKYPAASESHGPLEQQNRLNSYITPYALKSSLDVSFALYEAANCSHLALDRDNPDMGAKDSTSSLRSKQETRVKKIKEGAEDELGEGGRSFKDSERKRQR